MSQIDEDKLTRFLLTGDKSTIPEEDMPLYQDAYNQIESRPKERRTIRLVDYGDGRDCLGLYRPGTNVLVEIPSNYLGRGRVAHHRYGVVESAYVVRLQRQAVVWYRVKVPSLLDDHIGVFRTVALKPAANP